MATTPSKDMSNEELRKLQKARSAEYGVEALTGKGENLTFPSGYPQHIDAYADRTNLRLPMEPDGRLRAARGRFKQTASSYEREKSKALVHTRIVEAMLAKGMRVSISDSDPLDKLLPKTLRDRAEKAAAKRTPPGHFIEAAIERTAEEDAAEDVERAADGAKTKEWTFEAYAATGAIIPPHF